MTKKDEEKLNKELAELEAAEGHAVQQYFQILLVTHLQFTMVKILSQFM